jgi:aspartate racemase
MTNSKENIMKTNQTTHIGIIGGMGPQASVKLHQLIIEAFTRELDARDCHEFPMITHVSLPVKDFISDPEARHENAGLIHCAIKALSVTSVDMAVIACNTAHMLVEDLPALQRLPLISLPDSVLTQAAQQGTKRLGLLASPTTLRTGLYEKHAIEHGIEVLQPKISNHSKLEEIIRKTIAGQNSLREKLALQRMVEELLEQGADQVALGCTELSVVMSGDNDPSIIDSLSATTSVIVGKLAKRRAGVLV